MKKIALVVHSLVYFQQRFLWVNSYPGCKQKNKSVSPTPLHQYNAHVVFFICLWYVNIAGSTNIFCSISNCPWEDGGLPSTVHQPVQCWWRCSPSTVVQHLDPVMMKERWPISMSHWCVIFEGELAGGRSSMYLSFSPFRVPWPCHPHPFRCLISNQVMGRRARKHDEPN